MKTLIIITGISLLGFVSLLIKGCRDGRSEEPKDGTVINYDDSDFESNKTFSAFDKEDEHSPENSISDQTIARAVLRNKLKEIEAERGLS